MESVPLRIGVVGLGLMGEVMTRAIQSNPGVELAYVSDSDEALARKIADSAGVPSVLPIEAAAVEVLDEMRADAVAIATPPPWHAPLSISALQAGRAVLCEKPMAMSAEEARAMAEAADDFGAVTVVNHQLRFNPARVHLRALLREGYIGEPVHVFSIASFPKLAGQKWSWWHRRESGGGLLNEYGSHTVDLLRWLFGEITEASGSMATIGGIWRAAVDGRVMDVDSDDLSQIHLQFQAGFTADIVMSAAPTFAERRLEVHGTKGSLVLGMDDVLVGHRVGQEPEEFRHLETMPSLIGWPDDTFTQPFARLLDEFAARVRDPSLPSTAETFQDGWRTIEVLDQVRRSAGTKETL